MIVLAYSLSAAPRISNPLSKLETVSFAVRIHNPYLLHYSSRKYVDILFYDSTTHSFEIALNDGRGRFLSKKEIAGIKSFTSVTVGNLNNDGIDDIVVVRREQNQIIVLMSRVSDSLYTLVPYSDGYYPEKVTIGDITNDNIPDIMAYGKLHSGISLFVGQKNETFKTAKPIFENIPVIDLFFVTLNQDSFADIAVHNWLSNELTFYLGTGKLKFSEQAVLSFGADSVQVLCNDFNGDGITDVAVSSSQYKTIQVYHGDGLGSYNFTQTVTLGQNPTELHSAAFNNANELDLTAQNINTHSLSLFLNKGFGSFYEEIIYGFDSTTSTISAGDLNGDGYDDLMFFHSDSLLSIVWNQKALFSEPVDSAVVLPVGIAPVNLSVADLNFDGWDDILVSNFRSASISVLFSKGKSFEGQISIETPDEPASASLYAHNDTSLVLISVHKKNPKISILNIMSSPDSGSNVIGDIDMFSIPLPEVPKTVLADMSLTQPGISLYAFMPSALNAIVFYQQIKGVKFLSKSLVPVIPTKILYSTINDIDGDGRTDLVYIFSDSATKNISVGVMLNDSTGNYKGKVYSFGLPIKDFKKGTIAIEDFNGDQRKDCLLFSEPEHTLLFFKGKNDSLLFSDPTVISNINITAADQIQIYDYDNDGILDILYKDSTSGVILFAKGKGNGAFFNPQNILSIPHDAVFRFGDFNGDGFTDIAYTMAEKNLISVVYGRQK